MHQLPGLYKPMGKGGSEINRGVGLNILKRHGLIHKQKNTITMYNFLRRSVSSAPTKGVSYTYRAGGRYNVSVAGPGDNSLGPWPRHTAGQLQRLIGWHGSPLVVGYPHVQRGNWNRAQVCYRDCQVQVQSWTQQIKLTIKQNIASIIHVIVREKTQTGLVLSLIYIVRQPSDFVFKYHLTPGSVWWQ